MRYLTNRAQLSRKGDIAKSIFIEEDGCIVALGGSGGPADDFIYAKHGDNFYSGSLLSSVFGKDWGSRILRG